MGAKRNLRYHVVLVCKYRRKAIVNLKSEVEAAVRHSSVGSAFRIEDVAVEDGDHVHIVLRTTSTFSVDSMVNRIKQKTTFTLWESHGNELGKYYWGPKRRLWSRGYYVATVGEASLEAIKSYLKKQR